MTRSINCPQRSLQTIKGQVPCLQIFKLGIISRTYGYKETNGYDDFSESLLGGVLQLLDGEECDAALFSSWSVVPRKSFDLRACLKKLRNLKAVLLEEFEDGKNKSAVRYVVYHKTKASWQESEFEQSFGTLTGMKEGAIHKFVEEEMPKRILGNCCVLLCGESNGVKYSRKDKKVQDLFGLTKAIPESVLIILNPIHDRMTRFEMKLKRQFLSRKHRWVVSVWNRGKPFNDGKARDGDGPAWTVFRNGKQKEIDVPRIPNKFGVEIGILDIGRA